MLTPPRACLSHPTPGKEVAGCGGGRSGRGRCCPLAGGGWADLPRHGKWTEVSRAAQRHGRQSPAGQRRHSPAGPRRRTRQPARGAGHGYDAVWMKGRGGGAARDGTGSRSGGGVVATAHHKPTSANHHPKLVVMVVVDTALPPQRNDRAVASGHTGQHPASMTAAHEKMTAARGGRDPQWRSVAPPDPIRSDSQRGLRCACAWRGPGDQQLRRHVAQIRRTGRGADPPPAALTHTGPPHAMCPSLAGSSSTAARGELSVPHAVVGVAPVPSVEAVCFRRRDCVRDACG